MILYFSPQVSSAQLADPVQQPQPACLPCHWTAPVCGHIQPLTGGVCQQGEQDDWNTHQLCTYHSTLIHELCHETIFVNIPFVN